ncbi:MAG: hypothetical protein Q7V62_15355 [Actinomycetota bacterium]|nr:hypothetical protein [Actinomycetota bacterium]
MSAPATINAFDAGFTPKQITDEILTHFQLRLDAPDDARVVFGLGFGEDAWTTGTHMLLERMESREVYTALAPILLRLWGGEDADVQQGYRDIVQQLEMHTKDGSGNSLVDFVRFTEPDVWQPLADTRAIALHWGTFIDLLELSDAEEDGGPSPTAVQALLVYLNTSPGPRYFPYKEVAEELGLAKEDVAQVVLEWMLRVQGEMQHVDGSRIIVHEQGVPHAAERAQWMGQTIRLMVRDAIAADDATTLARVARLVTIARRAFGVSEIAPNGFTLLAFVAGELTANTSASVDAYVPLFAALTLVVCQSEQNLEYTDRMAARFADTEAATRAPFVYQCLLCQMVNRRRAWLKVRASALLPSATGRGPEYARRSRSRHEHAEQEAQRQASSLRAAHDLYGARMARYEAEMSQFRERRGSYAVPPQYPIFEHTPPQPRLYTDVPLLPDEYQAQREALQEVVERVLPEVKRLPLEIEADIMALVMDLPDAAERRDLALIMRDHAGAAHDPTLGKRMDESKDDDDMLDADVFGVDDTAASKHARH